jgi:hypothetical protein
MFIFLLNATPSTGASWFFFYTDTLKFSSTFLGTIGESVLAKETY